MSLVYWLFFSWNVTFSTAKTNKRHGRAETQLISFLFVSIYIIEFVVSVRWSRNKRTKTRHKIDIKDDMTSFKCRLVSNSRWSSLCKVSKLLSPSIRLYRECTKYRAIFHGVQMSKAIKPMFACEIMKNYCNCIEWLPLEELTTTARYVGSHGGRINVTWL